MVLCGTLNFGKSSVGKDMENQGSEKTESEEKQLTHGAAAVPLHLPHCANDEIKIDVVPLPHCGVRVIVQDKRNRPQSNQPRDGDIVSLWSVMSNAGDGFLQVTNVKVDPFLDKDEYVVNTAGELDTDATKFMWQTRFSPGNAHPWINITDLDPVILKIRGTQFKQDGDNSWYIITVDGDDVVAKPENVFPGEDATQTNQFQIFNPSRWPVYSMPEVGRNIRFNINNAGSNMFLGSSAKGKARKVSQEGDPEGANYYWPNPAILFFVYDRGQPI
ncbi:uncharacterized protein LOC106164303 [Lingula anatina]|uniref:Uncharacterized protein LOC106164303 n=1 Tax=Lingula anatina TaxID=7574 RepID=A0A1S3IHP2_LINAN|nr:uncharacterized protein LOC106164303 [Lingula anatina]|eukprot:XP_013397638.1 uncharacterized protein LOC106164303 [Lingula anatina]